MPGRGLLNAEDDDDPIKKKLANALNKILILANPNSMLQSHSNTCYLFFYTQ